MSTLKDLGEDRVIALFARKPSAGSELLVPNGDDAAAYLVAPGKASVVTTDTLMEGVHFDLEHGPAINVGRKLMAVNLSDIASMGALPRYALLTVSMPSSTPIEVAEAIAAGIHQQCDAFDVELIGGNVSGSPGPIALGVTLVGEAAPADLVRRSTAQLGDGIYVTGYLGQAKAGLQLALAGARPEAPDPRALLYRDFVDPTPRVRAGRGLAGRASAMCDVSDGFSRDLSQLVGASGHGALIESTALPISAELRGWCDNEGRVAEQVALEGGEDYELLFTASPDADEAVRRACATAAVPVSRVGVVTEAPDIHIRWPGGQLTPPAGGFDHF